MKWFLVICIIACSLVTLFSWIFTPTWLFYIYPKNYDYALRLADDSSLPETKANYLKEYLGKISTIKGQSAYIFMRPDMELKKQIDILKGLIKRFEDIAKIQPSEMAYQQGMYQLSGQEIDHQLDRVSGLFTSAKMRENPLVFFIIGWGTWVFAIPICICAIILYEI